MIVKPPNMGNLPNMRIEKSESLFIITIVVGFVLDVSTTGIVLKPTWGQTLYEYVGIRI